MVRGVSVILGVGLVILWIAGLQSPAAPGWLTWLDGVAAICAFLIAGTVPIYTTARTRLSSGPISLSIGLFALWIIGLATAAVPWLCWWTFTFACAFLLLGIAAGTQRSLPVGRTESEIRSEDRFRRSA